MTVIIRRLFFGVAACTSLLTGCGSNSGTGVPASETSPNGDISDSQAFVSYQSSVGGYQLEVPEGWARSVNGTDASFIDKFDGVSITVSKLSSQPTAKTASTTVVPELEKSGQSIQIKQMQDVNLPGGPALRVEYESNSDPNSVTGKQVRVENLNYYFFKNGQLALLRLWAPLGADNVDQWNHMAQSFGWK